MSTARVNRRALLQGAALPLAGVVSSVAHAAAPSRAGRVGQGAALLGKKRIEAAIATICLDGFGDEDFQPSFEGIPKLGIKNVELNCWFPRNLTPRGIQSLKERFKKTGLRPISIQASGFAGGDNHTEAREVGRLLWLIESCQRLGCRLIKCTGSKRGTNGGLDSLATVLKEVAPAAEQAGVLLTLENHFQNVLELPEDYDKIFAAVDSPAVGMCLDPAHFNASNVDVVALVERFAPRIYHVDLKDNAGPGKHDAVPFGTGKVPLEPMVSALIEKGYRGYLVVEFARRDRNVTMEHLAVGAALARKFER